MKKNLKIMSLIGTIAFLSLTIFISNIFDDLDSNSKNRLETSGVWVLTSTIYIDDLNPNYNWSKTAANNDWCSGSGTWNDPYLIENVTINSLLLGSCIYIENSNAFFIIRNCTLVNIGRGADPNYDSGIRLDNVANGIMMSNNCSSNNGNGIYFRDCNNLTISSNIANNNGHVGIYVYTSNNNTIEGNEIKNCEVNLYIYEGNNNKFIGNTISQPRYSISDNLNREIELTGYNNSFSGNIMNNCGIHLREEKILNKLSSHKIDPTNLVNDKPVYYYVQEQFLKKDNFSDAGQIILVDCDHSEIPNVNISNGACGISLFYCNNITIFNSSITYQYRYGILLYHSNNNNISQNSLLYIRSLYAIYVRYSNNNNISSNQISTYSYATGIDLMTCYWNTIRNNSINDCYPGIDMWSNDDAQLYNIFEGNIISNNSWYGIRLGNDRSKGNIFYLNNFSNNEENCEDNGQINYWDNGSIGNYWDDYNGNDSNDDGIGDTPYTVLGSGGNQDNYPIWDDGHNGSIILIDESASNNWEWTTQYTWCSGSGTLEDPYVIKDVNINGQNSSSCIHIKNSNAYFIIKDSTTYNASGADFPKCAGIELEDTNNGLLLNNNCSNNNGFGILIERYNFGCNNITIRDCIINNNGMRQIFLIKAGIFVDRSHNTTIINNTFNDNDRGIFLSNSHDNKIIENNFNFNWDQAVRVSVSNLNLIKRNYINGSFYGILLNANNNTVSFNEISFNGYRGIYLGGANYYNTIANNSIYNNSGGIYLDSGVSQFNLIYNNSLIGNDNNAFDDGVFNDWDNGIIGNYWDDYTGEDGDDDGIGDYPYIISGYASSQDNLPIWWDAPVFNIISPFLDDEFGNTPPSYVINITEGIKNTMWYTLDNGVINTTFTSLSGVINQGLWWDVPLGNVLLRFCVNDLRGWISFQEVTIVKILEYWVLNSLIIDDNGDGNYTWIEAEQEGWCHGSGTSVDPFVIEFIKIDGENSSNCLLIRNSDIYFSIRNSSFYKSGVDPYVGGLKLVSVSNGELLYNNCSYNNANGFVLDSCQYIEIKSNTVNNNTLSGILLINSTYIEILDNTDTINDNDEYGIYLINSHNNTITGNAINYNGVGIYLELSNYNFIDWNNILDNGIAIVNNGQYNFIGDNNIMPEETESQFPSDILIIILIIGLISVVIVSAVMIIKKRRSFSAVKEKEIS